jgi:hypothetical protein
MEGQRKGEERERRTRDLFITILDVAGNDRSALHDASPGYCRCRYSSCMPMQSKTRAKLQELEEPPPARVPMMQKKPTCDHTPTINLPPIASLALALLQWTGQGKTMR